VKLSTEAILWPRDKIIHRLAEIADELIAVRFDLSRSKADEARQKAQGFAMSTASSASGRENEARFHATTVISTGHEMAGDIAVLEEEQKFLLILLGERP
jgi:hypothetical protein